MGPAFRVNAEAEGSRIAVLEAEVRVQQGATEKRLKRGEEVITSPRMESFLLTDEIAWSPQAPAHVALLLQNQSSRQALIQAQEILRPDTPKWETVSVRSCGRGNCERGGRGGGPAAGTAVPGGVSISPGLLRVTCMPLRFLIEDAYVKYLEPEVLRRRWVYPVTGGPSWLDTELYTIMARAEGTPNRQVMGGPMLQ